MTARTAHVPHGPFFLFPGDQLGPWAATTCSEGKTRSSSDARDQKALRRAIPLPRRAACGRRHRGPFAWWSAGSRKRSSASQWGRRPLPRRLSAFPRRTSRSHPLSPRMGRPQEAVQKKKKKKSDHAAERMAAPTEPPRKPRQMPRCPLCSRNRASESPSPQGADAWGIPKS